MHGSCSKLLVITLIGNLSKQDNERTQNQVVARDLLVARVNE